ncbi:MAG: crotonobetainyl-CoA--carnitine CoA-transferase [Syntrophomonadaceae bacterium]|nr:crotonobetainyl-CoA--carnitine CoA-transferase [Syntrophomonadaceae bacterium]
MAKSTDVPKFGLCSGLKVVHMTTSVAGPFAACLFADNGADVIMLENPKVPDMTRNRYGNAWRQNSRNERNLNLNVPTPEGKEIFLELMKEADIFIEASVGGRWDEWGLSDEVLWEQNPKLVIAHITGFGQTGDPYYTKRPSYDPIGQAYGCYMAINGFPDRPPIPAMVQPIDFMCGWAAFSFSLAAVRNAEKTGKGESIDIAQYEIAMRTQSYYPMDYIMHGDLPKPEGNHGAAAGYGLYTCKDGYIFMLILGSKAIQSAVSVLGIEDKRHLFPSENSMVYPEAEQGIVLEKAIEDFCAQRTAEEVERILLENGISCSRVMTYADVEFDPHYLERGVWAEWDGTDGIRTKGVGVLPPLKNFPGQIWRGAPTIGLDNDDILSELGYSEKQIKELYDKGITIKRGDTARPAAFQKTRDWQKIAKERLGQ